MSSETLRNPFQLVHNKDDGLQKLMQVNTNDGNTTLWVTILAVTAITLTQYIIKHIVSEKDVYDSKAVLESNPSSTNRPDRMMKRFCDAFTCVVAVLILFAMCDGMKTVLPAVVFFVVSSLMARFFGEKMAYGCADTSAKCPSGLQDWSFFLLVSFIMVYGLSCTNATVLIMMFFAVSLFGAVVASISVADMDHVTNQEEGKKIVLWDMILQWAQVLVVLFMVALVTRGWLWNLMKSLLPGLSRGQNMGTAMGIDASSVY